MNKNLLICILFIIIVSCLNAADLDTGFEKGNIPGSWKVVNNNGDSHQWEAYKATVGSHSGDWIARVQTHSTALDDWLITPRLKPVDGHNILSFYYMSYSDSYPEDFNVKLSTTGNAISDFTVNLGSVLNAPIQWTKFEYDLSAYNGKSIYIAIQCTSDTGWFLYVDDIIGVALDDHTETEAPSVTLDTGFEKGYIPGSWKVINNNSDSYQWEAYKATIGSHSGDWIVRVQTHSAALDDWLITPRLKPVDGHNILSFYYMSYSDSYPEDFNVKLSTTGNTISDFTINLGSVSNAPIEWTEFEYDLSAYNGKSIYIAIQCTSDTGWFLYVDDIKIDE